MKEGMITYPFLYGAEILALENVSCSISYMALDATSCGEPEWENMVYEETSVYFNHEKAFVSGPDWNHVIHCLNI